MVILFYRPAGVEPFRVGFSTRRKLGNAVRRNRARRLMREIFRLHQHEVKPGMEYLFLWTGPGEGVGLKEVEREMVAFLRREVFYGDEASADKRADNSHPALSESALAALAGALPVLPYLFRIFLPEPAEVGFDKGNMERGGTARKMPSLPSRWL